MVYDHFSTKYPTPAEWTWPTWEEYQELKRKAREYDRLTKQPDCEKPEVQDFEDRIKKRLLFERGPL